MVGRAILPQWVCSNNSQTLECSAENSAGLYWTLSAKNGSRLSYGGFDSSSDINTTVSVGQHLTATLDHIMKVNESYDFVSTLHIVDPPDSLNNSIVTCVTGDDIRSPTRLSMTIKVIGKTVVEYVINSHTLRLLY